MDRAGFILRRKRRYLAQILEAFEQQIEPHLPPEAAGDIQSYKGLVRMRLDALARDAADVVGVEVNGAAQEIRDRLHPTGRP